MTESTTRPPAPAIEPADLAWRDGIPESARFGDVYFSRDNGLEETRYVFLNHNNLPDRFRDVPAQRAFVIAETGFGTGLNFLAAWQAWREHRPANGSVLHFISAERYPLTPGDLKRALDLWPELAPLAQELLAQYPPLVRGTHRLVLDEGRVRLTLYFGDVLEAWGALSFSADAWFLDGFAPALNPGMWLDQAMALIREHSRPGTTLATFTAVGRIRRALEDEGFEMRKTPGYGRKRDMIAGVLTGTACSDSPVPSGTVAIIGAGIAGTLLARNLASRGVAVTLIDAEENAGAAASGNLQGAMYVKLGVEFNTQTELALSALTFSQRTYEPYRDAFWHPTGLLQLAWNPQEQDRQARFLERNQYPEELLYPVDAATASELTGTPVANGGLWFPHNGWLSPGSLCRELARHALIDCRFGTRVDRLMPCNGKWHLSSRDGADIIADSVVIAAGHQTAELIPLKGEYRFKAIRGQVTHLPGEAIRAPKAVICGQKYLNPCQDGLAVTGATFDLHSADPSVTHEANNENLEQLGAMLPGLFAENGSNGDFGGRVGFRCTTHDYQPVAGMMADCNGHSLEGVYLLTGLGSKGLTYAPLLAEYVADQLTGQPACLPAPLAHSVRPDRMCRRRAG
ncbi:tRNA 5-methylaminomethyl-2-thiouridine biosynthesis bifunctional protein [Marinobacter pelagius]|uniref:tRNA 5-methylaminomethyl-2-thiouridine biosynthesis bifunctional protein MnmC n=1 Tax=Marinobacter pelagius TaxID=379482 RepID=A0A366GPW9_9GAMM|nr:bifunctional tRNA (5-methylaminomethyl-2-thiouridine)(34)-methyltransferase MnmD/FAD-dependent 5-carboxymethylaminomethyl-2-thiouridine(34) oxidoreductase MnmC [Marinobacter pelagius]RBP28582.1 tRNA 5-methylaminomethyl-2-thiouridine biosynthesis bifunctional protein [Marinobacter pelagius]